MASVILNETTQEREFHVPFTGPLPRAPFSGDGEIVLQADANGRPQRLELRFFPSAIEFQARLPKLIAESGLPVSVFDVGLAAARAKPVVIYTARPEVLSRVPGLRELEELESFLAKSPAIFNLGEYQVDGIELDEGERPN
jgi:hypothetical protein